MNRFVVTLLASFASVCLIHHAVAQESTKKNDSQVIKARGELFTTRSNPMAIPMPTEEGAFQFVIYGDRTGGNTAGLKFLRQAVDDTNLLDPDFVMTVGDMIQGYNRTKDWLPEMKEYKEIMSGLNMSWMPVAGNHDIYWDFRDPARPNGHHEANYEKHFGPLWYSFVHKEQGFITLYSDEGNAETGEKSFRENQLQNMSAEQMEFLQQALVKMESCEQIFVFLHHPRWLGGNYEGCNWPKVHKMLADAGNVVAVFAGHIHHMTYQGPVDGIEYYTLAATGGNISMDSPELGYLHHYNVVTVRENKFTVASYPVGTVIDPKDFKAEFLKDVETVRSMVPERVGDKLGIDLNGKVSTGYSIRIPNPGSKPIEVTIEPKLDGGWKALPDHQHVVVPPGKTEGMQFHFYRAGSADSDTWAGYTTPQFAMSTDYLHESARVRLPERFFDAEVTISADAELAFDSTENMCLNLRGTQSPRVRRPLQKFYNDSVRINDRDIQLPQGPFTVEAWVYPTKLNESRGVVAKTQSSEFAIFLHSGRPQFDVHVDGKYVSPKAKDKLQPETWNHVAGVFDGELAKLFVNGKLVQQLKAKGTRTVNSLPLFVGADPDGYGNPTREFAGQIDEVRLSTAVRYESEFEPAERHERDDETLLLLHFDKAVGPFLSDDSDDAASVLKIGQAAIAERN